MIGLYVFLFIFLYAFVFFKMAKWLATKVNGFFNKFIVFFCVMIVAFVVLLGDHYFGMHKFHRICEKESGLKVFEKKSKPNGIYFITGIDEEKFIGKINKYGLKFVERMVDWETFLVDGKLVRRDIVARYSVD